MVQIAMGTSLSGVSADQIVKRVAARFHKQRAQAEQPPQSSAPSTVTDDVERTGSAGQAVDRDGASAEAAPLGAVIINVQQTRLDGLASLRIFAKVLASATPNVSNPNPSTFPTLRHPSCPFRPSPAYQLPYSPPPVRKASRPLTTE